MAFTTLVARLEELDEGLPVALWIVVARAGALLALALAFRLAFRLAGGGLPAAIGGAVAAVALFLTPDWFQFTAHGSEAPMAVALMLWAIERQLDGRYGHVVVLGMDIHRDLARAVDEVGGPRAIAAIGTATANRALHSRLAWELGVSMDQVERVSDHRVVFRSGRERLGGRVYMRGRAKSLRTLARVGGIWVYLRNGITFPLARRGLEAIDSPFTAGLQGIHTSARGERTFGARVVTR